MGPRTKNAVKAAKGAFVDVLFNFLPTHDRMKIPPGISIERAKVTKYLAIIDKMTDGLDNVVLDDVVNGGKLAESQMSVPMRFLGEKLLKIGDALEKRRKVK